MMAGPELHQHWANVSCYLGSGFSGDGRVKCHSHAVPANTGQSPNAVSMLGQRRRLMVNIETALGECHVFADVLTQSIQQSQCWISVGPAS